MYEVGSKGRPDREVDTEGLAGTSPGAGLALMVEGVDPRQMRGYDRVSLVQALHRLVSHSQAQFLEALLAVHDAVEGLVEADLIFDTAASEIRAALGWTRRAAEYQLRLGMLLSRTPGLLRALGEGIVDLPKATVIAEHTCHLPPEEAGRVVDLVLPDASRLSTGQLRARVDRLSMEVDPESARERYAARLEERRVVVEPTEAGTANFYGIDLPAAQANAAYRRIDRIAKRLKTRAETRSIDQLRADVFLDLLSGSDPGGGAGRAVVDIRVDLETLAGLADRAGEIPGYGPVIADVARQVAESQEDAEWRVAATDSEGAVRHVVTTRRRPSAYQRRLVESFCPICIGPTCRMPAAASDLDHGTPWSDTHLTDTADLAPLCRYDHINKHLRGWRLGRLRPGVYQWTSPLGHIYIVGPDPP